MFYPSHQDRPDPSEEEIMTDKRYFKPPFAICNETFGEMSFDDAFAYAADAGYTMIEFAPFTMGQDAMRIFPANRKRVVELLQKWGLGCVGLHWLLAKTEGYYLTSPNAAVRSSTARYFAELAKLCRDLGGQILVLGSPAAKKSA